MDIIRYDVDKFNDNRKCKEFQKNMREMIRDIHPNTKTVEDQWKVIKVKNDIFFKKKHMGTS